MQENSSERSMQVLGSGLGDAPEVEVPTEHMEQIGFGVFSRVYRITQTRGNGEDPSYYVYKLFDNPIASHIQEGYALHTTLASLPHGKEYTCQIFGYTSEGLLMTDLSEGGKFLVMSSNDGEQKMIQGITHLNKTNPQVIRDFATLIDLSVDDEVLDQGFQEKAELIARETTDANIELSGDSIFFVLYPQAEYKLFVQDYDNVQRQSSLSVEELYDNNLKMIYETKPHIETLWITLKKFTSSGRLRAA